MRYDACAFFEPIAGGSPTGALHDELQRNGQAVALVLEGASRSAAAER